MTKGHPVTVWNLADWKDQLVGPFPYDILPEHDGVYYTQELEPLVSPALEGIMRKYADGKWHFGENSAAWAVQVTTSARLTGFHWWGLKEGWTWPEEKPHA